MKRNFNLFVKAKRNIPDYNDKKAIRKFFFKFKNWYLKTISRWSKDGPKGVTLWMFKTWCKKENEKRLLTKG